MWIRKEVRISLVIRTLQGCFWTVGNVDRKGRSEVRQKGKKVSFEQPELRHWKVNMVS